MIYKLVNVNLWSFTELHIYLFCLGICRLEVFDHSKFDKWVEKGIAPAITPSLKLYQMVKDKGYKVILLTGRRENHRVITVKNLHNAGFHNWDKLILRFAILNFSAFLGPPIQCSSYSLYPILGFYLLLYVNRSLDDQNKTATIYKSEKRDEMVKEGYRIRGNSGDQWSDLLGYAMSERSFKLPNPMYYIP